jgi:hypothetical protein
MIDLFSIVFSTAMVLFVIIRAVRYEVTTDTSPEGRSHFEALKDRTSRIDGGSRT